MREHVPALGKGELEAVEKGVSWVAEPRPLAEKQRDRDEASSEVKCTMNL